MKKGIHRIYKNILKVNLYNLCFRNELNFMLIEKGKLYNVSEPYHWKKEL
jgi:hypothetical protein